MPSIAELQAERDKTKAERAQQAHQADLAATLTKAELVAAAADLRRVTLETLDTLLPRALERITGEREETRLHYLLSDLLQDLLRDLAHRATLAGPSKALGIQYARGVRPREMLTVSKWADKHRYLSTGTNAPGQWRTDRTPYLREIMDSLSEHTACRYVTFKKSAGVGGSEALFNWVGYLIHHVQTKDCLLVVPTLELRDRTLNPKLEKMIAESPDIATGATTRAKRNAKNSQEVLEFGARARLIKSGANSPDSLRMEHLPYVICDEVAAFQWDLGGEGDPMTLIENRQRTFTRAKSYFVSTPGTEGICRIDALWQKSDQRRYHVPCPHCGTPHVLEFDNLHADIDRDNERQVAHAFMACPRCGGKIEEGHKDAMLSSGRWIAGRPEIKHHRGYHLNALYAPTGLGLDWMKVAQARLESEGDTAARKAFINTYMGEAYREEGDSLEAHTLLARVETYPRRADESLDLPIHLIAAGADVQGDRLEATIYGFGPGEEAWALQHIIIPGDTTQGDTWDALDIALADAGVQICCLDSGYNASFVYAFAESRRWVIPIKGMPGSARPLIEDERKRKQRLRHRNKRGFPVEPLGVDQGKAILFGRLKQPHPAPGTLAPGCIHFPNETDFDDEFFAQLAAERLVEKRRNHRVWHEWVKVRPRNEALDCAVYALAACRLAIAMPHLARHTAGARPAHVPHNPSDPLAAPITTAKPATARRRRGTMR